MILNRYLNAEIICSLSGELHPHQQRNGSMSPLGTDRNMSGVCYIGE